MSNNKITYNQYNSQEICYGDVLNNFIKEKFNDEYQDIVVHFCNDPVIIAKNTADLYCNSLVKIKGIERSLLFFSII